MIKIIIINNISHKKKIRQCEKFSEHLKKLPKMSFILKESSHMADFSQIEEGSN